MGRVEPRRDVKALRLAPTLHGKGEGMLALLHLCLNLCSIEYGA